MLFRQEEPRCALRFHFGRGCAPRRSHSNHWTRYVRFASGGIRLAREVVEAPDATAPQGSAQYAAPSTRNRVVVRLPVEPSSLSVLGLISRVSDTVTLPQTSRNKASRSRYTACIVGIGLALSSRVSLARPCLLLLAYESSGLRAEFLRVWPSGNSCRPQEEFFDLPWRTYSNPQLDPIVFSVSA